MEAKHFLNKVIEKEKVFNETDYNTLSFEEKCEYALVCVHSSAPFETKLGRDDLVNLKSDIIKKALDGAFSFGLKEAPLPKQSDLTKEQLHEWVGEPDWSDLTHQRRQPEKFDSTYKALKMWEREFYVPLQIKQPVIEIPGLKLSKDDGPSGVQFDLQKLGKYIRPKEYRLYKVRKKSAKLRKDMDLLYPMN